MTSAKTKGESRRKFLKTSLVATAATVAAPAIAQQAGPIAMRWQSTWPSKDIFHEYALDFAKKVNDMAGSRLKIEVLPAGSVVLAGALTDAVPLTPGSRYTIRMGPLGELTLEA